MWRDPVPTRRQRPSRPRPHDPRARDVVRRDRGGARDRGRGDPRERRLLAGRPARALRRRRARGRLAAAPRARRRRSCARRSARRARRSTTSTRSRSRRARVSIGALLVGVSAAKALAWARGLPLAPVDHLHGHVASLYLEPDPVEPPFLCLLASGGHTLLLDVQDRARLPRARHDARRRRRRGVRQGRAAARPRLSRRRARSTGSRGRAIPTRSRSPSRACDGLDFSFSGRQDGAALRGARPRRRGVEARRADLAASLPARDRPRARRADARGRRAGGARADRRRRRRRGQLGAARVAPGRRASRRSRSAPTTRR